MRANRCADAGHAGLRAKPEGVKRHVARRVLRIGSAGILTHDRRGERRGIARAVRDLRVRRYVKYPRAFLALQRHRVGCRVDTLELAVEGNLFRLGRRGGLTKYGRYLQEKKSQQGDDEG